MLQTPLNLPVSPLGENKPATPIEEPLQLTCAACGCDVDDDEREHPEEEGKKLCTDCFFDEHFICSNCAEAGHHDDECYSEATQESYCQGCFDDLFFTCAHCDEPSLSRHSLTACINGRSVEICERCCENDFFSCESCDRTLHNDYYEGDGYCTECHPNNEENEEEESGESIYFTNDAPPVLSDTFTKVYFPRFFGVELESCQGSIRKNETCFNAVRDGSTNGPEYVSPILQGDAGLMAIKTICDHDSIDVDSRCGFHLHLDARDLNPTQAAKIGRLYKLLEPLLFRMVKRDRVENTYCKPITTKYESAKDDESLYWAVYNSRESYLSKEKYHSKRYEFLNMHSYFFRKTIEIRLHHGTFSLKEIRQWVNLNQAIFSLALGLEEISNFYGAIFCLCKQHPKIAKIIKARLEKYSPDYKLPILDQFIQENEVTP